MSSPPLFSLGDTVTLEFAFSPSEPDANTDPQIGVYNSLISGKLFSGNNVWIWDGSTVGQIGIHDSDPSDLYEIFFAKMTALFPQLPPIVGVSVNLINSGSVFSSDHLPATLPGLTEFDQAYIALPLHPTITFVLDRFETDRCPFYSTPNNSDVDGNGIGDECECGDQNGDGTVNVLDLLSINAAIFNPLLAKPLCDTNNDGKCNVQDIVAANQKIFGRPAYCSRYPPPGP